TDLFDAKPGEAAARSYLVQLHAVVEAVADADVREAVDLCAHLTQLGGDDLIVASEFVVAEGPARAERVEAELARSELGNAGLEHAAEIVDLALANQPGRRHHGLGFH